MEERKVCKSKYYVLYHSVGFRSEYHLWLCCRLGIKLCSPSVLVLQVVSDRFWNVELINLSPFNSRFANLLPDDSSAQVHQGQWFGY